MRDINYIMPKIPNMLWGAVTNVVPTKANINELKRVMPQDGKWHTLFESPDEVIIDDVAVRRKSAESMT